MSDPDDPAGSTYEQARDELARVVTALETGGLSLEDSLALWERGEGLATHCQRLLDGARERLARQPDADSPDTGPDAGPS